MVTDVNEELKPREDLVADSQLFLFDQQRNRAQALLSDGEKSTNTASIWRLARKLMSREWARALGKSSRAGSDNAFKQRVEDLGMRSELMRARERELHEAQLRIESQLVTLKEALLPLKDALKRDGGTTVGDDIEFRLSEAVGGIGHIYELYHTDGVFELYFEPWVERRTRRLRGESRAVVYHIRLDGAMEPELLEVYGGESAIGQPPAVLPRARGKRWRLEEGLCLAGDNGERTTQELERKLSDMGRLRDLRELENGWRALIEPWVEIRERRLHGIKADRRGVWYLEIDRDFSVVRCIPGV